jgi:hypothetical protein
MVAQTIETQPPAGTVDASALKTNQALIVGLVVVAFVLGREPGAWIVAFVALSLAIGAVWPGRGPFQLFYRHVLRAAGVVRPRVRPDDPAPHRFAQALGAAFLALSAAALFAGWVGVGWILAWIVVALALVNLLFGFCAGCFAFLHLRRVWRRAERTL